MSKASTPTSAIIMVGSYAYSLNNPALVKQLALIGKRRQDGERRRHERLFASGDRGAINAEMLRLLSGTA